MGTTKRQRLVVIIAIIATAVVTVLGLYWVTMQVPPHVPPFLTLYHGDSDYRYGEEDFDGGCLVFRTAAEWRAFWSLHVHLTSTKPPLPAVDFDLHMVLGCFLGWQSSSGPSIEIEGIVVGETSYISNVDRNYTQTQLPAVTNPYDIVRVPFTDGPVVFLDVDTGAEIPQISPGP